MVNKNKPWFIKITDENHNILEKWFLKNSQYSSQLYKEGICGYYSNLNGKLIIGMTRGGTVGNCYDFGVEISFRNFECYILNNSQKTIELW